MSKHKPHSRSGASRNTRLADQIQKDLAEIIQRELSPAAVGLVTLSKVDLSADYAHAKVYFTVIGAEPQTAERLLNEKAGYLHSILFKLLHIHTVPTLKFIHDENLIYGMQMSRLIDQAVSDEPSELSAQEPEDLNDAKIRG